MEQHRIRERSRRRRELELCWPELGSAELLGAREEEEEAGQSEKRRWGDKRKEKKEEKKEREGKEKGKNKRKRM